MSSIFFLVLRRMRAPLIVLIVIYAISVIGLVLIPGADAEGKPVRMSFFHAFYFVSYTATTIGFGELPYSFTDAQRFWVILTIYLSVIGWSYSILTLLALFQHRGFRQVLTTQWFYRRVLNLRESFYLICGYGETGGLLCRALDNLGIRFVVIDIAEDRINELDLQEFTFDALGLVADARVPQTLQLAGLGHPHCKGVIALTNDDSVNLTVAIAVRLLNPQTPVLCRAETQATADNMASFDTSYIINPFEKFGEYLALAVYAPACYRLLERLTGIPGTTVSAGANPPRGRWVICGYGRFAKAVVKYFDKKGLQVTIIAPPHAAPPDREYVQGLGTEAETLLQAAITGAVGIVGGTDDDVNNLSIVVTARKLNPRLFTVLRQNSQGNRPLFQSFHADQTVIPREIIAHECLAVLTTPLLSRFLLIVKRHQDEWAEALIQRLEKIVGEEVPTIWSVCLNTSEAPALLRILAAGESGGILAWLLRDPSNREQNLPCIALLLIRDGQEQVLPSADLSLAIGDQILFAGIRQAKLLQALTLQNVNVCEYIGYAKDIPGGWIWQWLNRWAIGRS
jgi:Trk K+ transport system NAD-binding subunit